MLVTACEMTMRATLLLLLSARWTPLQLGALAFSGVPSLLPSLRVVGRRRPHTHQLATPAPDSHHVDEFWGKERSEAEVKSYIHACLDALEYDDDCDARVQVVSAEPPLVIIHDFLSADMCQEIIDTAVESPNLKRSTTGESNRESQSRTSSTVWLRDDECQTPLRVITDKVSVISGLPPSNMENLQVCRYLPGQEFKLHTDHQDSFNDLECRGRVATCLLYLSEPEAGGETWFPGLGETEETEPKIAPTQGSAVFFWNTIERPGSPGYDPHGFLNVDLQLRHAGLPVVTGEKFIANRWVHPIDIGSGVRGTKEPAQATV